MVARNQADTNSKIVFVRETFQVIPNTDDSKTPDLPNLDQHSLVKINTEERQLSMNQPFPSKTLIPSKPNPSDRIKVIDDPKVSNKVDIGIMTENEEDFEDRTSVITQGDRLSNDKY